MYRPDGWKYGQWREDETHLRSPTVVVEERLYNAFEAGADAVLEGLGKTSDRIIDTPNENGFYDSVWGCFTCPGRMVFIPDEQVKKDE